MLFYLMGLVVLYLKIGSLNLSHLSDLPLDPTIKFAVSLIVVSLGVKSAFFPVNNWLPKAHAAAPSAVSAILSGLLVKAGFIVLFKLERFLDLSSFSNFLMWVGLVTAITGFIFAISQNDIKSLLAFSTISQSGLILIGLSGSGMLFIGGFLHLINHALYKTLLFLAVGLIINKYHIRKIQDIKGVFKQLPILSTITIIGVLSITGFPLTNGYVSKYLIKYGMQSNLMIESLLHLINIGTMTMFIKMISIFKGETKNKSITEQFSQNLPIVVIATIILLMGIVQMYLLNSYFNFTVTVDFMDFVTYAIYIFVSYTIYHWFIKKEGKLLYHLRHYEIGFKDANILLVIFTITTIILIV
jgi:multicomponent Na+:H+ antiporter subunit D